MKNDARYKHLRAVLEGFQRPGEHQTFVVSTEQNAEKSNLEQVIGRKLAGLWLVIDNGSKV